MASFFQMSPIIHWTIAESHQQVQSDINMVFQMIFWQLWLCHQLTVHCLYTLHLPHEWHNYKAFNESRANGVHNGSDHATPFVVEQLLMDQPSRKQTLLTIWCHGHAGQTHTYNKSKGDSLLQIVTWSSWVRPINDDVQMTSTRSDVYIIFPIYSQIMSYIFTISNNGLMA